MVVIFNTSPKLFALIIFANMMNVLIKVLIDKKLGRREEFFFSYCVKGGIDSTLLASRGRELF